MNPITAIKVGLFIKDHWKKILPIVLIPFVLITSVPIVALMVLFPMAEDSVVDQYKALTEEMDSLDWQQVLIYDFVLYDNDYSQVTTASILNSSLNFLEAKVKFYKRVCDKNGNECSYQYVNTKKYVGNQIKDFLSSHHQVNNSLTAIKEGLNVLDATDEYEIELNILPFDTVIRVFESSQREWAKEVFLSNIVAELYGEYYMLPEHIDPSLNNLFAFPTPHLNTITSPYGWRSDPYTHARDFHTGVDISGPNALGKPIIAIGDGKVLIADYTGARGKYVIIQHEINGRVWHSTFMHMSQINVRKDQVVKMGDVIGAVGNTGRSTGPHLHLELRQNGNRVNPLNYIR